jgi:hypothetical protein
VEERGAAVSRPFLGRYSDCDRRQTIAAHPISKLAEPARPPAERSAVSAHRAAVVGALADLAEQVPAGDGDRRQTVGGRAVAELAFHICSPAQGLIVVDGHPASQDLARTQLAEATPGSVDPHRCQAEGGGTVAELAKLVEAPAVRLIWPRSGRRFGR